MAFVRKVKLQGSRAQHRCNSLEDMPKARCWHKHEYRDERPWLRLHGWPWPWPHPVNCSRAKHLPRRPNPYCSQGSSPTLRARCRLRGSVGMQGRCRPRRAAEQALPRQLPGGGCMKGWQGLPQPGLHQPHINGPQLRPPVHVTLFGGDQM
jgi:hypothetical protein